MVKSAPPENPSLPEVKTAPLTEASDAILSAIAPISAITSAFSTFIERPGMSQVASMTPSESVSTRKLVKFMIVVSGSTVRRVR